MRVAGGGNTTMRRILAVGGAATAVTVLAATVGDAALALAETAPKNTAEPVISGTPRVGSTLSTTKGSWSNEPTGYAYQWVRCDAGGSQPDGSDCASIGGATTSKYVPSSGDVGKRLRVRVTASNKDGSTTVASNPSSTIESASAPQNKSRPTISGRAEVNERVRSTTGSWSGREPIRYAFQWLRCDRNGDDCGTISGATDDAYTVRDSDIGRRLRSRVTATNSDGSASRTSSATSVVPTPSGPSGAIKLPNGETSIPVTSVPSTERLIVDSVVFDPSVVRSRDTTLTIRVKVKDTRGYVVRDAIVFIRSTPLVTSPAPETKTGTEGTVTFAVRPQGDFPIRNGYSVQFFVKAFRQGDNPLGGIAGYRLVQVATAT